LNPGSHWTGYRKSGYDPGIDWAGNQKSGYKNRHYAKQLKKETCLYRYQS